jgi:hypothetical protein
MRRRKTNSTEQAHTSVAQTVTAAIAETQALMPTDTPFPTSTRTPTENPTATPVSASPTPQTAQDTVPPSVSQVPQPANCDNAIYIADGTDLEPGSDFTKTWQLQNTGTCTWDSTYAISYAGSELLGTSSPAYLNDDAFALGESVDISVVMLAPDTAGSYFSYW